MHGLALALDIAASVACDQRNLTKAELDSSELIQLSTRHHFALWMAAGVIYRGCGAELCWQKPSNRRTQPCWRFSGTEG
jgi:hypothetical protein